MLDAFLKRFSSTFYVQLREQRIKVTDMASGETFDQKPLVAITTGSDGEKSVTATGDEAGSQVLPDTEVVNPFSHPRMLLADFTVAEALLQAAFQTLNKSKFTAASPLVILHPMEKIEGGLTHVETRAFRELGLGAGARESLVYVGSPLSVHDFDLERVRSQALRD